MKTILLVSVALLFSTFAAAGETGFIYQGKEYTVFKDGKKVGKTFEEMFPDTAREQYSKR
jgi:hypothetical protein